jgi:hypothetical protein
VSARPAGASWPRLNGDGASLSHGSCSGHSARGSLKAALTELIGDKRIELDLLDKFVRLAADEYGLAHALGKHGHAGRAGSAVARAVAENGIRPEEDEVCPCKERWQGWQEAVRARDAVAAERRQ